MDLTQYEALLNDAEARLDRLRALYDQFFQGLERVEPALLRKEFDRILKTLRTEQPRNTAMRFRFQQLVQRNVTLDTHWRKVMRQIEDGTYRRDLIRARKRRQGRSLDNDSLPPQVHEIDMTMDMDVDGALDSMLGDDSHDYANMREPVAPLPPPSPSSPPPAPRALSPFAAPSLRPSQMPPAMAGGGASSPNKRASQRPVASKSFRPPKPDPIAAPKFPSAPKLPAGLAPARPNPPAVPGHRPPPPPTPPKPAVRPAATQPQASANAGMPQGQLQHLFERYVSARKGNNERTDNLKLESLQKTVDAMLPKLREKHAGKHIDFDVIVRDGKVALKPITK